ncbi:3' exoribonuclease protein, putative [Cryptosporidium muris RN66]|uniref:3' exoribonuclease protein, putative n=1 Tax=Cryptosporidium muris (strain RN66) TaxID=441375 RepID=B6ACS1_CRYMR|nr:3' exoribonuclease protein, putative [Cryptosporidium muris RN66]EEA05925.1 3' exoribonuclease protein, putative [Cryptosporidium muris RN66]|eukprot:XP_002140274.1 3' exoribonuclease protein [Cryptosporidium muris RN66]
MKDVEAFMPLPVFTKERFNKNNSSEHDVVHSNNSKDMLHSSSNYIRNDSRIPNEVRPINIKTGTVATCDGSAYFSIGRTRVLCTINGPKLTKSSLNEIGLSVTVDYRLSPFCKKMRQYGNINKSNLNTDYKAEEKYQSLTLEKVIQSIICREKYTRMSIDCYIYIIEDDGCALSAAISCLSLALCDAKIEIIGLFSSVTVIAIPNNSEVKSDCKYICILDPTYDEINLENSNISELSIGLCTLRNQVVHLSAKGSAFGDIQTSKLMFSLAEAACTAITNEMKEHLISEEKIKQYD